MRVVFLGTGDFGQPALRALLAAGHEVRAAVSQPDRPSRRGLEIRPTPIHAAAAALGIPHIQTEDVNALNIAETFAAADVAVVVAFGQKIGQGVLAAPTHGCFNIHASLLPKYRGAAPFQWAIINGDDSTGVTVFRIDERWDAGDILAVSETPIRETETAAELHDRLAIIGAELIVETLSQIDSGTATPSPQDKSLASRAPKLTRADGVVDWSQPARKVVRRIHGLWSWPAATCIFASRSGKRERVQLARAEIIDETTEPDTRFPPGAIHDDGSIQTGCGRVRLLEVKPAGRKLISFDAFANGRDVAFGDRWLPLDEAT
ncbi:MAG: methionyl-tRNA formyltransferase [Planctomycetes bacterium]|nr:methionyl-tRNA formyltransferase [Planctomycetota bacterium]